MTEGTGSPLNQVILCLSRPLNPMRPGLNLSHSRATPVFVQIQLILDDSIFIIFTFIVVEMQTKEIGSESGKDQIRAPPPSVSLGEPLGSSSKEMEDDQLLFGRP